MSAPASVVEGRLEGVVDGRVLGWAWSPVSPLERIWVSVFIDEEPVGLVAAGLERPDLRAAGLGDGAHGFAIELPAELRDGTEHAVRVMAGRSNTLLPAASGFIPDIDTAMPKQQSEPASSIPATGPTVATPAQADRVQPGAPALPVSGADTIRAVLSELIDRSTTRLAESLERFSAGSAALRDTPIRELLWRYGPQAVLATALVVNLILLLVATRHLGFFQDDFLFILYKRGWGPDTFLAPMSGHLSLIPVTVFKLLFLIVGIAHSWPYRLVLIGIDSACVVLIYRVVARGAGRTIALVLALLLLMLGSGTGITDLVWITQIGFLLSLAAGVAALGHLSRGDVRSDRYAAALLTVSLASSSPSLAMCAGALVYMLATHAPRRRYWVVLGPLALYALWYIGYGTQELLLSNVPQLPNYVAHIASAGLGALAGLSGNTQPVAAALFVAAVTLLALRAWRGQSFSPLALAGIASAMTFWITVELTRAQTHNAGNSRYLYPSAVFILIALGGLLSWRKTTMRGIGLITCGLLFIGAGDLRTLKNTVKGRVKMDNEVRTVLGAAEVIGHAGNPDFKPNPPFVPYLPLGTYLAAVHQLGSPDFTPAQIKAQGSTNRRLADQTILAGEQVALWLAPRLEGATAPAVRHSKNVTVTPSSLAGARCLRVAPTEAEASINLIVAPGQALYLSLIGQGTATLYARRLAATYPQQPMGVLPSADGPRGLGFPIDGSPLPWHVRVLPTTPLITCLGSASTQ